MWIFLWLLCFNVVLDIKQSIYLLLKGRKKQSICRVESLLFPSEVMDNFFFLFLLVCSGYMLFLVPWHCWKHLDAVRTRAQTLSSVPNVSLSWQLNTRVLQSFMLFTGLESRKVHTSKKTKGNRNGHIQTRAKPNWIPCSHHGIEHRKHSRS